MCVENVKLVLAKDVANFHSNFVILISNNVAALLSLSLSTLSTLLPLINKYFVG